MKLKTFSWFVWFFQYIWNLYIKHSCMYANTHIFCKIKIIISRIFTLRNIGQEVVICNLVLSLSVSYLASICFNFDSKWILIVGCFVICKKKRKKKDVSRPSKWHYTVNNSIIISRVSGYYMKIASRCHDFYANACDWIVRSHTTYTMRFFFPSSCSLKKKFFVEKTTSKHVKDVTIRIIAEMHFYQYQCYLETTQILIFYTYQYKKNKQIFYCG